MSETFNYDSHGPGSTATSSTTEKPKTEKLFFDLDAARGSVARVPLDLVGCGFKDTSSWGQILAVLEHNALCAIADAEASAIERATK